MTKTSPQLRLSCVAVAAALASIASAQAVHLNADGRGQALIFPYYTVRTATGGNAFNTYLTVVNHTADAKALRVRLREGRAARPVLDFNLYLSPNDAWASALVPTQAGAQLISVDTSCTNPAFVQSGSAPALPLHSNAYTGVNSDGFGDTLDRTREGYVDIIEMATLSGASAAAITHNSAGVPANCAAIRTAATVITGAPSGGLSGTLTLINVNSGLDFTLNATALDALSTRAFFRPPGDPYPDFSALEIDPVSMVVAHGQAFRSAWTRPIDAVSAVLMQRAWVAEWVMDNATASLADVVATLPTRHHYVNAATTSAPFMATAAWRADCGSTPVAESVGETLAIVVFNREEQGSALLGSDFPGLPPAAGPTALCAAAGVASVRNGASHVPVDTTRTTVFGSTTRGLGRGGSVQFSLGFQNGWTTFFASAPSGSARPLLVSQPSSLRTNLLTGQVTAGSHTYYGLPVLGFFARTFSNGTLTCSAGSCQGNYGGAFPYRYLEGVLAP